ncbi:MAG: in [Actinomycetota bacterium]|nr:in [Actinomycetota bacterium]
MAVGWCAASVGPVAAAAPAARQTRYIVTLRPSAGDPGTFAARVADRFRFPVRHVYDAALRGFAADLPPAAGIALAADPNVAAVTPDTPLAASAQVIPTGIRRIHGDLAASAAPGYSNAPTIDVDVAVLDSGIDPHHPDLNVVGGTDCTGGGGFDDRYGHGSHTAGIIGALNNTIGVVGVAPGARLWAVKVLDDHGDGTVSDLLCGVDWVTSTRLGGHHGIEVANLSVGGGGSDDGHCGQVDGDVLHQAICRSVAAGTTYVAAAGNDHVDASTTIPAAYPEVITVSALADSDGRAGGAGGAPSCRPNEHDDTLASFSNYGKAVALVAPGVCILSTLPTRGRDGGDRDAYGVLSGTSAAAPHVAGAAARWLSKHPGAAPADVRRALVAAGSSDWDDRGDPDGVKEPLLDVSRL